MADEQHIPDREPYLVLARKYRPEHFEDVIGQDVISHTLRNAVRTGRIHHAYLFTGPRGVGKTTMARVLAKALNCESSDGPTPDPCCRCDACVRIAQGGDIDVIEIDGASNTGVDHIRELRQNAKYAPSRRRFKIYYIDEVHMLSRAAFNALLKTLEEPPPRVKFIFSTTDPQMIPETVVSRCQRFDFRRIASADIVRYLEGICAKESLNAEPGVLAMIARSARGGLRDALGTLDQLAAMGDGTLTLDQAQMALGAVRHDVVEALVDALIAGEAGRALELCHQVLFEGADVIDFTDQLSEYLRDLLVARHCGAESPVVAGSLAGAEVLQRQSRLLAPDAGLYMIQLLREAKLRARRDAVGRLALELAIIKMASLGELVPITDALAGGEPPPPRPAPQPGPRQPAPERRGPAREAPPPAPGAEAAPPGPATEDRFSRLKQALDGRGPRPAEPDARAETAVPEGMDPRVYRRLQDIAGTRLRDTLAQEGELLKLFVEADKTLGLEPLKIEVEEERSSSPPKDLFQGES